ncbi:MAG: DUF4442 domain-containing protein, partial [Myxococcota bacterium]
GTRGCRHSGSSFVLPGNELFARLSHFSISFARRLPKEPQETAMLAELRKSLYTVPLIQTLGAMPTEVAPGRVTIALSHRPSLLDHTGALHSAALFAIAELAAGVLVATHPQLADLAPRRSTTTIRYVSASFGDVTALAELPDEALTELAHPGRSTALEVEIGVRVLDAVDNEVAKVACRFVILPSPDR